MTCRHHAALLDLAATAAVRRRRSALELDRLFEVQERHAKQLESVEVPVAEAVEAVLRAQVESVTAAMERQQTTNVDLLFDVSEWRRPLIDAVLPPLAGVMLAGIERGAEEMGARIRSGPRLETRTTASEWLESLDELPDGFEVPLPGAAGGLIQIATERPEWMRRLIADEMRHQFSQPYWDEIAATTKHDIERVVTAGIADGESIATISRRLRDEVGVNEYYRRRTENIARTESGHALNAGRNGSHDQARKELGPELAQYLLKQWLSVLALTTRPAHAALNLVNSDPVDDMWDLNGVRIPWPGHYSLPPGDRCNCFCTTIMDFGDLGSAGGLEL